jgi:uncharacterized protein YraI
VDPRRPGQLAAKIKIEYAQWTKMSGLDSKSQNLVSRVRVFFLALMAVSALSGALYAQVTKGSYTTTTDAPLRSGPGSNLDLVTTLPKGIQIKVVRAQGD